MKNLKLTITLIGILFISCSENDSNEIDLYNEINTENNSGEMDLGNEVNTENDSNENDSNENNHEEHNNMVTSENEFNLTDDSCPSDSNIEDNPAYIDGVICRISRLSELKLNTPIEYEFASNIVNSATISWKVASGDIEIISEKIKKQCLLC